MRLEIHWGAKRRRRKRETRVMPSCMLNAYTHPAKNVEVQKWPKKTTLKRQAITSNDRTNNSNNLMLIFSAASLAFCGPHCRILPLIRHNKMMPLITFAFSINWLRDCSCSNNQLNGNVMWTFSQTTASVTHLHIIILYTNIVDT